MLELRTGIIRNNGDRYFFTRSSMGQYRWVDAATNMGVPDSKAHLLSYLYGHRIINITARTIVRDAEDDVSVADVNDDESGIVYADDAINGGNADTDIQYGLALDDVEALSSMGSGRSIEPCYADEQDDHPADANDDFPVEMVA